MLLPLHDLVENGPLGKPTVSGFIPMGSHEMNPRTQCRLACRHPHKEINQLVDDLLPLREVLRYSLSQFGVCGSRSDSEHLAVAFFINETIVDQVCHCPLQRWS